MKPCANINCIHHVQNERFALSASFAIVRYNDMRTTKRIKIRYTRCNICLAIITQDGANTPMKHLVKLAVFAAFTLIIGALLLIPSAPATAQNSSAIAWSGQFYPTINLSGSPTLAVFPNGINVNWGALPPTDGNGQPIGGGTFPADNFSARFSAAVTLQPGFYQFSVTADDGVRLIIGGAETLTLIDDLNGFAATGRQQRISDVVQLTGGTYNLTLDYFEATGDALLQVDFNFSQDGSPLPTITPVPIATGSVVRVRGLSVRTGPFLGASRVAVARPLNEYPLLAFNRQEGLFTWYLIQFDEDTFGWVSGRYFDLEGNLQLIEEFNPPEWTGVFDPPGTVIGVTRSTMNFRTLPSERTPRVGLQPQLEWGAEVEILARTVQGGRDHWYQVRYRVNDETSYVGWIFAPFVGIDPNSDPIDSVPIL